MKKIKLFNEQNRKYWIITGIIGLIALPVSLIIVNATTNKRNFVLANYQSYMGPNVEKQLNQKYGLDFDSFENVEDAKKLILNNSADIVNTTTYEVVSWAQEGIIQKLDWTKFNLPRINNANDALSLFTPTVQEILKAYDLNGNGTIGDSEDNLLNYGVPYFLQDLVFAYRGSEIPELAVPNIKWSQVLDTLIQKPRFHTANHKPHLIALDDPRTMYSIPRAIQTEADLNVNPNTNATINELSATYNIIADQLNKLGSLPIKFNSDSVAVLNSVAYQETMGGFMFNGDAIYAASGGDNQIAIAPGSFHVVRPSDNVLALDLMVFNKNMNGANLIKSYDIIKDLCITFDPSITNPEEQMTFENFDSVNYTTPIKTLYDYINNPTDGYFSDDPVMLEAFQIASTNVAKKIERSIDDLTKSNFSFAWIDFKHKINGA